MPDAYEQLAARSQLAVYRATRQEIERLEAAALAVMKPTPQFQILQTMRGVGAVLGLTIALETGEIGRFRSVGHYASYYRCVDSQRLSNGKKNGEGNAKAGNKYLSWAFSEAAHDAVRYEPRAQRFYERKRRQRNGIVAIRAMAPKLCRAAYFMMRDQRPFDAARLFG